MSYKRPDDSDSLAEQDEASEQEIPSKRRKLGSVIHSLYQQIRAKVPKTTLNTLISQLGGPSRVAEVSQEFGIVGQGYVQIGNCINTVAQMTGRIQRTKEPGGSEMLRNNAGPSRLEKISNMQGT